MINSVRKKEVGVRLFFVQVVLIIIVTGVTWASDPGTEIYYS